MTLRALEAGPLVKEVICQPCIQQMRGEITETVALTDHSSLRKLEPTYVCMSFVDISKREGHK